MNHENPDTTANACETCAHSAGSASHSTTPPDLSRRSFLQLLAAGVTLLHGCGGSDSGQAPAPGSTANPIAAVKDGSSFKVAGAGQLKNGEALAFRLPDQSSGIVFQTNGGKLRALSAKCTHSGCIVEWQQGKDLINCPCHGSRFDVTGNVLNGPATKPLGQFKVVAKGSDALISKA